MSFEIGLLLFNRPILVKKTIFSLIRQNPKIDLTHVHILVDGYSGSKDEYLKLPNCTNETIDLVQRYLPQSKLIVSKSNLGIALAYERLGEELFVRHKADFGVFLEEDLLMRLNYFKELEKMKRILENFDQISMFSATGDSANGFTGHSGQFKPMNHFWNYALRREHFLERRGLLSDYISIVSENNYWNRNDLKIYEWARDTNLHILGTSQDLIKRGIAESLKKMFITSRFKFAKNLGRTGEHFTPEVFKQKGYDNSDYFNFFKTKFTKNYQVNFQELRSLNEEHKLFLIQNPTYA
jgi:hypothetical protein